MSSASAIWEARIYIFGDNSCQFCEKIKHFYSIIKENFARYNHVLILIPHNQTDEWNAHWFEFAPTLVLPLRKPIEQINPDVLIDENMVRKLLFNELSEEQIHHFVWKEDKRKGVAKNLRHKSRNNF